MTQEAIEELSTLQCHDLRAEPPGEPSRRSEPPDSDFRRDQNRLPQHLGSDGTVKGRRQALLKALKANEAIWVAMEQKANVSIPNVCSTHNSGKAVFSRAPPPSQSANVLCWKQLNDNPSLHNTGSVYSVRIMKRMAYTSPNKVSGQWWRPFIQSLHPLQWETMSFDQKKFHFRKCLFRKFTLDHQGLRMLPHFIALAREKVPEGEKKASKRFYGVQSQCCADMNFEKRLTSMKLFLGVICTMHKQLPVVQLHPASPSVCFMESTMLEDLNGRCVKVEQLDENDQVLGDCDRAVPVVSKQIHPKGSHALVVP